VVRADIRYWTFWIVEVTVNGIKATVVTVGITLVEVSVAV
jgi:hypothetical protein